MDAIVIYSPQSSPRLIYVLDWIFRERLHISYRLTSDRAEAAGAACLISYGESLNSGVSIPASGLLFEEGIVRQAPAIGEWDGLPTLFSKNAGNETLPFDLFSAVFYLLSRYEEYYPHQQDKHGRYPPGESILFQQGWLTEPIVDEWIEAFRKLLESSLATGIAPTGFHYLPSYDIDIAYSHSFKGITRIAGAYMRAMLKGDVYQIAERTQVLKKKKTDPFDSFSWIRHLHDECRDLNGRNGNECAKPLYFILSALKRTTYDRNIDPRHPAMIRVIKQLAKDGECGIHPSYYATATGLLNKEKQTLEGIIDTPVHLSRQHYIKLRVPDTYYLLTDCGISEDYSMGYGSQFGFRAGTGSSFLWYDLKKEAATQLRVHPFCFMDTTAHYELGLTPQQAFEELTAMANQLKKANSTLVTVFHNFSLGTAQEWTGWNEAYRNFLLREATIKKKAVV